MNLAALATVAACIGGFCGSPAVAQQVGLTAITTFGSNGWLAPGSNDYLAENVSGRFYRGLAYNPVTKNLILVSRTNATVSGSSTSNNIVVLNGTTGVVSGTLSPSGISGGTFPINMAGVGDDGQVYVANLQAGATSTTANFFKVYKWENETTTNAPSLAFQVAVPFSQSGTNPNFVNGWRFGDAFAVRGSGTSTRFIAAGSTSGSSSGNINNSNFMLGSLDSSNFNTIYRTISATNSSASNNGYRLGLTWKDDDTIIGLAGGPALVTDFVTTGSGQTTSNATVVAGIVSGTNTSFGGNTNNRVIDYLDMGGRQYAATVAANFGGMNVVQVYDISSGTNAVLMAQQNLTSGTWSNPDGTGSIAFAKNQVSIQDGFWFSVPLYTLNTNNGIQAMVFTVPEPSTWAMVATGAGLSGLAGYRRRSRRRSRLQGECLDSSV